MERRSSARGVPPQPQHLEPCRRITGIFSTIPTLTPILWVSLHQAFVGYDEGQRCFPDPVISNDEGTKRIPYVPSGRDIVGQCINEQGRKVQGLTIEGELNKVRIFCLRC